MGKFIVLEGIDGSGTTTQTKKLSAYLSSLGAKVTFSAEPTKSAIGQEIRRLLSMPIEKNHELLTALALSFAADRMLHISEVISPGLKNYDYVILDRYVLSSLVYQGLHLPTNFIKEINQYALKPDLVIVLDADPSTAYERLSLRTTKKDFYESPALLAKIRSRYLHFAEDKSAKTVLVDANGTVEQVHSHIANIIKEQFLK